MFPNDGDQTNDLPASSEDVSDDDLFYSGPVDTSHFPPYFTETELRQRAAYDWCLRDPAVQQQYGGQVVAATEGRVLGAGKTHGEALRVALQSPDCPPREEIALVYIEGWPLPRNIP